MQRSNRADNRGDGRKYFQINSVEGRGKKLSLVLNCAWNDDDVPGILDTLNSAGLKVSFFMVGKWAERFPEAARMIFLAGHEIGNHSYSHPRMTELARDSIVSDITRCSQVLKNITGKEAEYFSAPYGDYNDLVIEAANELGYLVIQSDVDSEDWRKEFLPEDIHRKVLDNIQEGSIVLLHSGTLHTAQLLPSLIAAIKEKGYEIVPLSYLLYRDDYVIEGWGRQRELKSVRQ